MLDPGPSSDKLKNPSVCEDDGSKNPEVCKDDLGAQLAGEVFKLFEQSKRLIEEYQAKEALKSLILVQRRLLELVKLLSNHTADPGKSVSSTLGIGQTTLDAMQDLMDLTKGSQDVVLRATTEEPGYLAWKKVGLLLERCIVERVGDRGAYRLSNYGVSLCNLLCNK